MFSLETILKLQKYKLNIAENFSYIKLFSMRRTETVWMTQNPQYKIFKILLSRKWSVIMLLGFMILKCNHLSLKH